MMGLLFDSHARRRRREYNEYIQSPEWAARRRAAIVRALGRCQVCYSKHRLNAHHRTYERFRNEAPEDLTVLCDDCHRLFHARGRWKRRRRSRNLWIRLLFG